MHVIVFTTCTAMSLLGGAGMAKRRDDSCATNPRCELGGLCVLGVRMCVVCAYVCCVCICVLCMHMCVACAYVYCVCIWIIPSCGILFLEANLNVITFSLSMYNLLISFLN